MRSPVGSIAGDGPSPSGQNTRNFVVPKWRVIDMRDEIRLVLESDPLLRHIASRAGTKTDHDHALDPRGWPKYRAIELEDPVAAARRRMWPQILVCTPGLSVRMPPMPFTSSLVLAVSRARSKFVRRGGGIEKRLGKTTEHNDGWWVTSFPQHCIGTLESLDIELQGAALSA